MSGNNTLSQQNLITTTRGVFTIEMLQQLSYTITNYNIPGLSTTNPRQATPFIEIPQPGDTLVFEPLTIEFIVQADLENWLSIYNWLLANTFPNDFGDRKKFPSEHSEGNLILYTSHNNPFMNLTFNNMLPVNISELNFNTTDTDVVFVTASATFEYSTFDVKPMGK